MHARAGRGRLGEQFERGQDHPPLLGDIARVPEGASKGEFHRQRARRADSLRPIRHVRHQHSGQTCRF